MCGIIAIAGNKSLKDSQINGMLSALSLRGPDDIGFERFPGGVIGQTRLSIVDLVSGHQPMRDNTNPYSIVFNGEIYGYRDLRVALEKRGHKFRTTSDTEVILKSYAEYGRDCVKHLDGMFAFAIWDDTKKELFTARDRFGKKPFYYAYIDGEFFGASEMKAIFSTNLIKGKIDGSAICDYLRLGYIPPHKTIYKNIHTLLPAHAGIVREGKIETWRYWNLKKKTLKISREEAKSEIKRLLDEAAGKRMVADVEVGSFLSGGVDSTLATYYAKKHSQRPIKTFAVGYGDHINELPFALEASKKIGTEHYTLNSDIQNIADIKKVIAYFDEPHGDSSNLSQYLVSKLAASKVKVALSGDGADEFFMGYGWYQKYWHTPRSNLKRVFGNPFHSYKKATEIFSGSERRHLMKVNACEEDAYEKEILSGVKDPFDKINRCDFGIYLPGQLLTKIDRAGMMNSLEVRSPFLDTALIEFVYSLPLEYKISKTENKILLKEILSEIMPKEFVERRKQGFGAPVKEWLASRSVKSELDKILSDANHPLYTHLKKDAVERIVEKSRRGDKQTVYKVWTILCLALWLDLHKKYHE
ncbi:MAG: asparagine synthase (glutamine-hydrolyzing) [Patescibacteria group bacterium]